MAETYPRADGGRGTPAMREPNAGTDDGQDKSEETLQEILEEIKKANFETAQLLREILVAVENSGGGGSGVTS